MTLENSSMILFGVKTARFFQNTYKLDNTNICLKQYSSINNHQPINKIIEDIVTDLLYYKINSYVQISNDQITLVLLNNSYNINNKYGYTKISESTIQNITDYLEIFEKHENTLFKFCLDKYKYKNILKSRAGQQLQEKNCVVSFIPNPK